MDASVLYFIKWYNLFFLSTTFAPCSNNGKYGLTLAPSLVGRDFLVFAVIVHELVSAVPLVLV